MLPKASEVLATDCLLTEEQIAVLSQEGFRNQSLVHDHLSLLGKKVAEQTSYIEALEAKLEDLDSRYNNEKEQKELLNKTLIEARESLNNLQTATAEMKSENELLAGKLGEIDSSMQCMDTLVERHKTEYNEAKGTITGLEVEIERIQNACENVDETMSRLQVIRYEVESEEKAGRPVEDFVEDVLAENRKLKTTVKELEQIIETKEYKIMDLELNLNGLRETMKEIQESYADQSAESKGMEEALRTMQRLYKDQTNELESLKAERDQYEKDVRDMLGNLKISEETTTRVEVKRRTSELLNQSYAGELARLKAALGRLKKEKEDAMMMVGLKEDVIQSLQESVKSTTDTYFQRLEAAGILNEGEHSSVADQDVLTLLDTRFKALSEEIEKKDNLLLYFMKEKDTLEKGISLSSEITTVEMKDKIEEMTEKAEKLQNEVKQKDNQVEEKEMIITHLVSVINRYAFNDKDDIGEFSRKKSNSSGFEVMSNMSMVSSVESSQKKMGRVSSMFGRSKSSATR